MHALSTANGIQLTIIVYTTECKKATRCEHITDYSAASAGEPYTVKMCLDPKRFPKRNSCSNFLRVYILSIAIDLSTVCTLAAGATAY